MSYFDLGTHTRKITTTSPEAQIWFDRGLNWLFGFNHGEAVKCFRKAIDSDPECAMAYWGVIPTALITDLHVPTPSIR